MIALYRTRRNVKDDASYRLLLLSLRLALSETSLCLEKARLLSSDSTQKTCTALLHFTNSDIFKIQWYFKFAFRLRSG